MISPFRDVSEKTLKNPAERGRVEIFQLELSFARGRLLTKTIRTL